MLSHSIRELVLNTGIGGYKSWEDCFLGPFTLKSREMAYSNQGFFVDKSRHGHAIWTLGVHPPTSPCPTLLLFYSHTTYLPRTSLDVTSWSWRTYVTLVGKGLISLKPDQQRDFLSTCIKVVIQLCMTYLAQWPLVFRPRDISLVNGRMSARKWFQDDCTCVYAW